VPLSAFRRGFPPQAAALVNGLSAQVAMLDSAYDADRSGRRSPTRAQPR
jgi:hypothetical protein